MLTILRNRKIWTRAAGVVASACIAIPNLSFAAAPPVVVDVQQALGSGLNLPQSLVVAPNKTYYVADTGNNRVLAYSNGGSGSVVNTGTFSLSTPNALAIDSMGDLFIGDSPASGTGRVIEAHATNGVLNGVVTLVVSGNPLQDVFSLAEDSANTLYIGDDLSNALYTVASGTTTVTKLNITGLPSNVAPSALAVDSAGNLYVGDLNTTLYEVPAGTLVAAAVTAPGFDIYSPTGLTFDPKGNLYVLTLLGTGDNVYVLEIPNGDTSSAFRVPISGVLNGSAIGFNSAGTMYITDFYNGTITGLVYSGAVNMGEAQVGDWTAPITFNYEMNAAFQSGGFAAYSKGDFSSEFLNAYGTCNSLNYTTGDDGGPISPSNPYSCVEEYLAAPAYPGIRSGAIVFNGTHGVVYSAFPVFATGLAGSSVIYPLQASTTVSNVNSPAGLAVSGLDQKLYVVDAGTARVLVGAGPTATSLTPVSTAPVVMNIPLKIAINGNGDLYIADFGVNSTVGQIVVVPRSFAQSPYSFNPGNLLQHPLSLAFDSYGNLYIGDSGPEGANADSSNPGYIVEYPAAGGPGFKLSTGSIKTIYPQGIAVDPYTSDVYVADGGNVDETDAKVVKIPANGGSATDVTPPGVTQAVDIAFDPAEQYYVLDQNSSEITVVRPNGTSYILPFDNTLFTVPRAFAITNGGESFVEANLNGFNNNPLIFLNGKSSTLAFGSVRHGRSSRLTATVNNVGSAPLRLGRPYYTAAGDLTPFSIRNGRSTCKNRLTLNPASTCSITVRFSAPSQRGSYSKSLNLNTDGYLTNDSILNLTGTSTN